MTEEGNSGSNEDLGGAIFPESVREYLSGDATDLTNDQIRQRRYVAREKLKNACADLQYLPAFEDKDIIQALRPILGEDGKPNERYGLSSIEDIDSDRVRRNEEISWGIISLLASVRRVYGPEVFTELVTLAYAQGLIQAMAMLDADGPFPEISVEIKQGAETVSVVLNEDGEFEFE